MIGGVVNARCEPVVRLCVRGGRKAAQHITLTILRPVSAAEPHLPATHNLARV